MDEWEEWKRKREALEAEPKKEQIQSAPYTPPGPPEATIEKKLERIERQLDLFKAQIAGIVETMATLGYDISTLKRTGMGEGGQETR